MENIEIAKIIASQIGSKALYMIGASNLMATDRGVQFKIMRNERKVTHISIKLNNLDLYDLEFINLNKKTISFHFYLHLDLHSICLSVTEVALGTMGYSLP